MLTLCIQFITKLVTGHLEKSDIVRMLLNQTLTSMRKDLKSRTVEGNELGIYHFSNDKIILTYMPLKSSGEGKSQVVQVGFLEGENYTIFYKDGLPISWYRREDTYWTSLLYHPELKKLAEDLLREVEGHITKLFM